MDVNLDPTLLISFLVTGILPDECDSNVRVTYTVYNRMGLLLKSLVTVTRVTPAYKLARRQSPDSYVILYNIYMGEPQFHQLGKFPLRTMFRLFSTWLKISFYLVVGI